MHLYKFNYGVWTYRESEYKGDIETEKKEKNKKEIDRQTDRQT